MELEARTSRVPLAPEVKRKFLGLVLEEGGLRVKDPLHPNLPTTVLLANKDIVEPDEKLGDQDLIKKIQDEAAAFSDITGGKRLAVKIQLNRHPNERYEYWPILIDDAERNYLASFERIPD